MIPTVAERKDNEGNKMGKFRKSRRGKSKRRK
jgi:hypothetical protein